MALSKAQRRVLTKLNDKPQLLGGSDINVARWLSHHGFAFYCGLNHFKITPAGRAALEVRE